MIFQFNDYFFTVYQLFYFLLQFEFEIEGIEFLIVVVKVYFRFINFKLIRFLNKTNVKVEFKSVFVNLTQLFLIKPILSYQLMNFLGLNSIILKYS